MLRMKSNGVSRPKITCPKPLKLRIHRWLISPGTQLM